MRMDASPLRVAILGASGYAGGELVRFLAAHPGADITFLGARGSAGKTLEQAHPHLAPLPLASHVLAPIEVDAVIEAADAVFLALPHGATSPLVPAFLDAGLSVVDLAGDFRLPADRYPEWYGFDHPAADRLEKAVYGLPELFAERISGARLVANPGCYPTPVILGISPLLAAGLIEPGPVHVDGKTGLSGAGRAATESSLFASTEESIRPYRVPGHQHTPEMEHGIELATGTALPVIFVPHLVPTVRGVLITAYASLADGVTTEQLTDALVASYGQAPFVRVLAAGNMVDSKRTRGTNMVELQAVADPRTGTALVIGAVDNLIKGAAGQAIQNFNIANGFDEGTALPTVAVYP
ncbi:MAG: N-acetyl-gamma-glutamyl-phosphate reductase [Actinomycetota bacterium]|jgi:N-acetyl-gamma-glutamyl-phosphate reductase|nr:N-acetyl-gamma-glutamyl-phosphate reductase [Actinomycetota bacterium]